MKKKQSWNTLFYYSLEGVYHEIPPTGSETHTQLERIGFSLLFSLLKNVLAVHMRHIIKEKDFFLCGSCYYCNNKTSHLCVFKFQFFLPSSFSFVVVAAAAVLDILHSAQINPYEKKKYIFYLTYFFPCLSISILFNIKYFQLDNRKINSNSWFRWKIMKIFCFSIFIFGQKELLNCLLILIF